MFTKTPRLSIGLPVYNGAAYVGEAIASMLAQTFDDFELLIADNASTDGTEAICRRFALRDARIRYVRSEHNEGAAANFNKVFAMSRAPYFKWLAADDRYAPTFIDRCVALLDADPALALAYAEPRLVNDDGTPLRYEETEQAYVDRHGKAWRIDHSTRPALADADPIVRYGSVLMESAWCLEAFGVIRAAALRQTGLIRPFFGSDRVLVAELSLLGPFAHVEEPLFDRRCHPSQSMYQTREEQAHWITGGAAGLSIPQLQAVRGYARALRRAPLTVRQKLGGYGAIVRLAFRSDKVRRLVIPGPDNYFGIDVPSRRRRPAAPHDLPKKMAHAA